MIKGIIIDDEKGAREAIDTLVKKYSTKIEIVAQASDIETGLKAISIYKPDFIFLDIQFRNGTGFDLLNKINTINFEIIFITAFNTYALEAFKFSAFNYILKPINVPAFCEILNKLESQISKLKENLEPRFKVLIENNDDNGQVNKLIVKNIDGFEVVEIKDIVRLEADRNYTHFITMSGKKLTTSKNIGEYENLLKQYGFFRIHQSSLVNLRHITSYQKSDGGLVKMISGDLLKISRLKKSEFLQQFN